MAAWKITACLCDTPFDPQPTTTKIFTTGKIGVSHVHCWRAISMNSIYTKYLKCFSHSYAKNFKDGKVSLHPLIVQEGGFEKRREAEDFLSAMI